MYLIYIHKMASQERSICSVQVNKIECNQQSKVINAENSWEYGKVPLSESLKLVELEVLEKDLSEFIHYFTLQRDQR